MPLGVLIEFPDQLDESGYASQREENEPDPRRVKQLIEPVPHQESDKSADRQKQRKIQILSDSTYVRGVLIHQTPASDGPAKPVRKGSSSAMFPPRITLSNS